MSILLSLLVSLVAAVVGTFGPSDHTLSDVSSQAHHSVESALAELSPRGEAGGFAIPASGESQTCSLSFSPGSVNPGDTTQASWAPTQQFTYYANPVSLYRCNAGTSCPDLHDHWTNAEIAAQGYSRVYNYTNNCAIWYNCPTETTVSTSGLDNGTYKYWLVYFVYGGGGPVAGEGGGGLGSSAVNNVICNADLTISSAPPPPPPPTKCTDGIDNDGDLLTDAADPDCVDPPPDDSEDGITVTLYVKDDNANQSWTTNDITIDAGDQVSLRWVSTGQPDSCGGNGAGFNTGGAINGTDINITEPSAGGTNNYRVLCSKTKTASKSDSLNVTTRSPVSIDADPKIVYKGETSLVTWSTGSSAPANCSVTGPEINLSPLSSPGGSQTVTVNGESTYTIDCGAGGTDSVTIRILPVIQET